MGGKVGGSESNGMSYSSTDSISSAAALVMLRNADDLLALCARNKGQGSRREVASRLRNENWVQLVFTVIRDPKTSLADLRFISKVFEKIVEFATAAPLAQDNATNVLMIHKEGFHKFLNELSSGEILFYGASLWLAYCKLFVCTFGTKMPSKEWNNFFSPMETWFRISDREALIICLRVWTSLIGFLAPKLTSGNLRDKLLSAFCKPLRSHAVINKLSSPEPIILTYTTLISAFAGSIDNRFEELIICFLRFMVGNPVVVLENEKDVEEEISKPINGKNVKLVLQGRSSDYVDYLVDSRPHHVLSDTVAHVFPLISSVLGVQSPSSGIPECCKIPALMAKYGVFLTQVVRLASNFAGVDSNSICACFVALAQRIENIEDVNIQRSESRFLFIQIRAWIAECTGNVKDIESALAQLFRGRDLSIHANTLVEWPSKTILEILLEKSAKVGEFLEIVAGTLPSGVETDSILLNRLREFCTLIERHMDHLDSQAMLRTWSRLAAMLTSFARKTDDINEGSLLRPDFSTTFGLLTLLFKIANHADKDMDAITLVSCSFAFTSLYAEAQSTVRHEVDCSAETILHGVFGTLLLPETPCCVHLFTGALTSIVDIYPFGSLGREMLLDSAVGFNALGEMGTFVDVILLLGRKIITMIVSSKNEKLPRFLPSDFHSLVKICKKLFVIVEKPNLIRTMFLSLCDLLEKMLAKIYEYDPRLKEIVQDSLAAYTVIVENVKNKMSGPFDDSLLSECAPLLTKLLTGRRGRSSKLRKAACSLWKSTFDKSQSLTYPAELREALLPLVNKRMITAPGLSKTSYLCVKTDSNEYDTSAAMSPSNASGSIDRPRRTRKSVNLEIDPSPFKDPLLGSSNLDETSSSNTGKKRARASFDVGESAETPKSKAVSKESAFIENKSKAVSIDSVQKSTAFNKCSQAEVGTHSGKKSTPRTKRKMCVSLLDDDSINYISITPTGSAKKMKLTDRQREIFSEKKDRMPFLDEDSQNSAVITNLPSEFDVESSQSTTNNMTGSLPSARPKDDPVLQGHRNIYQKGSQRSSFEVEIKSENFDAENADSSRRKPKFKLNFDQVERRNESLPTFVCNVDSESGDVSDSNEVEVEKLQRMENTDNASYDDDIAISKESTAQYLESLGDSSMDSSGKSGNRRSRKKGTPSKYLGQKRRDISRSTTYGHKKPLGATPKREGRRSKTPAKKICVESRKFGAENQKESTQLDDEVLVLRENDGILNLGVSENTSLDESFDEKGEGGVIQVTPEKQNEDSDKMAATPTLVFVQRIAGTPGILKKLDSPSTAEKKLRRVHFGNEVENNTSTTLIDELGKAVMASDQIPESPKGIVKRSVPRRPFFNLQTTIEQGSKVAALPTGNVAASPIKTEADSISCTDDDPIFLRLANCQESIGRVVGKLLPISSTNGAIAARKSLEAQGIVRICDLALMSRREVSLLNIKKPRIETAIRALSQFARDHLKSEAVPVIAEAIVSKEELLVKAVDASEVTIEIYEEGNTSEVLTEGAEAEVQLLIKELVESVECFSASSEPALVDGSNVEIRNFDEIVVEDAAVEKRRLWKAVNDAYRQVDSAVQREQSSEDLIKIRRAASRAARALLDLVTWCDDAT